MTVADGSHQTAAQRGGEAKDKDRPLSDLQRDKCAPAIASWPQLLSSLSLAQQQFSIASAHHAPVAWAVSCKADLSMPGVEAESLMSHLYALYRWFFFGDRVICCADGQQWVCTRFEDLLRGITMARPDICEAMVFALDNAESATEVRISTSESTQHFLSYKEIPDDFCLPS